MIEVKQLSLRAGDFLLNEVSFRVPDGAYAVMMGRTGSGKTTLLEAIAGLKPISSGSVLLAGREVTRMKPGARGVGYVPQDAALFSTLTVAQHLEFALEIRGVPKATRRERVEELADLLQIGDLLHRRPAHLSGGERQRVALGRALSAGPGILLLDEPLSALDEDTRQDMYSVLKSVRKHSAATVLHVTHSRHDAEILADTLLRLRNGTVEVV